MGFIQPMTNNDILSFQEAADMSKQLADMWETFLSCQNQYLDFIHNSTEQQQSNSSVYACSHTSKLSPDQEFRNAGLDSKILSPYSEYHENETVTALELPSVSSPNFDPNSTAFHKQIFNALGLDTSIYSHVRRDILGKFKNLIRKYPTAFWLLDMPLTVIPGHEHRILTGDAAPSYQLPYRKSPSELSVIKSELERMLKLKIIEPSNSPWGSPCILVKKPAEQGKPQPPRFVVDYHHLNAHHKTQGGDSLTFGTFKKSVA